MRPRQAAALIVATAAVLSTAACSGSSSTTPTGAGYGGSAVTSPTPTPTTSTPTSKAPTSPAPNSNASTLTISGFAFSALTVKTGAKVTVQNEDTTPHTVTIQGTDTDVTVGPGGEATFTAPDKAGKYPLSCDFHATMAGTLTVT